MNRRSFTKKIFLGGMAAALPDFKFLREFSDYKFIAPVKSSIASKVAVLADPKCVSPGFVIDHARGSALLEQAILTLTGKPDIVSAIKSLFPEFKPGLRVSIKVNTASSEMPSHPFLAHALAGYLVKAGLKPGNIIIWERSEGTLKNAGYVISNDPDKVRVIATDTPGFGYDQRRSERVHGVPVFLTSILTQHSDYQINLGVLKHHWFTGVATCLKNHYGSIPLLDKPFMTGIYDIVRLHWNACDPYLSELNALIEEKVPTVLHISDGLLGIYNSGPLGPPQWVNNEILLSRDPVAVDTLSFYRVEKKRKSVGLPPLLNKAMFLKTSANMGLGTNNPDQMDIMERTI